MWAGGVMVGELMLDGGTSAANACFLGFCVKLLGK